MNYAIGIDLGGTKIEASLVSAEGHIAGKVRVPTCQNNGAEGIIGQIVSLVHQLNGGNILGVGIGTPGFVKDNTLTCIANLPSLAGVDLQKELAARLGTPVFLENDANCFALAEHMFGAGRGLRNIVGLIMGTGIGAGIIINNALYSGSTGGAGEVGHMIIDPSGPQCSCGQSGDFESWCSGPNIIRRYREAGGVETTPELLFSSQDERAQAVVETTLRMLGIGLANIINFFNPDSIILGGGLSNLDMYERLTAEARKYSAKGLHVNIVKNVLGDSSGVVGAASLVFGHHSPTTFRQI